MVALAHEIEPKQPVLEVTNLVKRFGVVEVLKDISIEMAEGDFLVLVGPSGCGKSTLLNCIAGLDTTTGGRISIGGRDVTEVPPRDRDIAMVFQSYALYPTMTVAENIAFGMKVRNVPKSVQADKVRDVSTLLQISHLLDRKPGALSGGQRQRVAMGRALVREPVLFLFDEPLSNLDAKLRVELRGEIKRLHERLKASIVYVTHDQIEAMTLGTRIVVLNQGLVQQIGTPEEVFDQPANLFVADFMGSPPMNLIPATLVPDGGGAILKLNEGNELTVPALTPALAKRGAGEVIVGLRPEAFALAESEGGVSITAQLVESSGSDTFLTTELGGKTITARLPGRMKVSTDGKIRLAVDTSHACFFDPVTGLNIH
ncbi:MAG: ABC transporter ATP-binding protein [Acetobacteraceae bacterium]|nr:MAG: ABC transporter ATP-binding protein [Acetobacteraceae bacterium]